MLEGDVPALLKQLILFKISVTAGNQCCTALHGHAALNLDPTLTYDDLLSLSSGSCGANLPPSYPVAIDTVLRASVESKSCEISDFDLDGQLKDEGFSESEIDELLAVGFFSVMMNMMTDVYDVPWESPFPTES